MQSAADWAVMLDRVQEAIERALADIGRWEKASQDLIEAAEQAGTHPLQPIGRIASGEQSETVLERAKSSVSKADNELSQTEDPLRRWLEASGSLERTVSTWPRIGRG
jgi:hypothetical protein